MTIGEWEKNRRELREWNWNEVGHAQLRLRNEVGHASLSPTYIS